MVNSTLMRAYLFASSVLLWNTIYANPMGGVVSGGEATITQPDANTLQINQSTHKGIIDWQTFNIRQGETTRFVQPSASSITLNRVDAMNGSSSIHGNLTANGQVWLINPAGILFGPSAQVNVGGILATTSNITNEDFMAGRYRFTSDPRFPNASVINHGNITVQEGGLAGLVGNGVKNTGVIHAKLGTVLLGAAQAYTLDFDGDQLINFVIHKGPSGTAVDENNQPLGAAVKNTGVVSVGSGMVPTTHARSIVERSINMGSLKEASHVSMRGGRIILAAGNGGVHVSGKMHAPRGRISVRGGDVEIKQAKISASSRRGSGGSISIIGDKSLVVKDTLIQANGGKKGGSISLLGQGDIKIVKANIAANGHFGGGQVLIGGNWQGQGPEINSKTTHVDAESKISASALTEGDGGKIVIWSDHATSVHGDLAAKGGMLGGNGGAIETSGHYLDVDGIRVSTHAMKGQVGTWLLDPTDITISTAANSNNSNISNTFTPTSGASTANINTTTLSNALASNNIIVTTVSSGGGAGNITISSPLSWSSGNSLTLTAQNNILINAAVTTGTSASSLILNAAGSVTQSAAIGGSGGVTIQGAGTVTLSQANTYSGPTRLNAGTLRVSTDANLGNSSGGIIFNGGTLQATSSLTLNSTRAITINTGSSSLLNTSGSGISVQIDGNVNGAGNFTVTTTNSEPNGFTLKGSIGNTTPLTSLTVNGPMYLGIAGVSGASITTSGSQTYNGSVRVPGFFDRTISGGTITFNDFLALGSGLHINTTAANSSISGVVMNGDYQGTSFAGVLYLNTNAGFTGTLSLLNTANTYTAQTVINGGTLIAASLGAIGSNSSLGTGTTSSGIIMGQTSPATLSYTGGTTTINRPITISGNSTIQVTNAASTLNWSGAIGGTVGTFTKSGPGTLNLSAANTYTQGTTISDGVLSFNTIGAAGTNTALGNSSSAINIGSTGTLRYIGTGDSSSRPIILTGSGGTLDASGSGALTLSGGVTGNTFNLVLTGTGSGTQNGVIGTTTGTLTKNGSGTWTLGGGNTYSGSTTLNAGTLRVSTDTNLGNSAAGLIFNGGTLQATSSLTLNATRAITINSGSSGLLNTSGSGISVQIDGNVNGAGNFTVTTINSEPNGFTLKGSIGNSTPLTSLTVNGPMYLGVASTAGALINTTGSQTYNGSVRLPGYVDRTIFGGTITFNDFLALGSGLQINTTASNSSISGVVMNGDIGGIPSAGVLYLNTNSAYTGTLSLLNTANTYSASTYIDGGTLVAASLGVIGTNNSLGTGSTSSTIIMGRTTPATLSYTGGTTTINRPITLSGNSTIQVTNAASTLNWSGAIGGSAGTLTKSGPGTLNLSAANTYSLGTTVNNGTLAAGSSTAFGASNSISILPSSSNTAILDLTGINTLANTSPISFNSSAASSTARLNTNLSINLSNNISLNGATNIFSANANTTTLSGTINGSSAGVGALSLQGAGTFSLGNIVGGTNSLASLSLNSATSLAINTSSITTSGAQTYSGVVTAIGPSGTTFTSTGGGAISLANSGNSFISTNIRPIQISISGGTNNATVSTANAGGLYLGTSNISGNLTATTSVGGINLGTLTTGNQLTALSNAAIIVNGVLTSNNTSGGANADAIVLSGTTFQNNFGAGALLPGTGRFLVWSQDLTPSNYASQRNGQTYAFKQYNATRGITTPQSTTLGSGFLYTLSPTLTPSLVGSVTKTYDTTTAATLASNNYSVSGAIDGDTVTLNNPTSGLYNTKNVGTGKNVSVSGLTYTATQGSVAVSGYNLSSTVSGNIGNINAANLNVTGITALNKVYNANTTASLSGTAAITPLGSDTVTLGGAGVGAFANKNVANNKAVTVSGYSISGTDAGNYTLIQPQGLTAHITPANLLVTGITANNKVYDTNTVATLSGTAAVSALGSDSVTIGGTGAGAFADKNVANNKAVTVSGYTISGTDAGNYTLIQPQGLTAHITPANLLVTGITANNKVYDSTTQAFLSGSASITPLGFDEVTITGTPESVFLDKHVENNKVINITGFTLSGADSANYILIQPTGLTAHITPATLTSSGILALNKEFNPTRPTDTSAILNLSSALLNGLFAGDNLDFSSIGYQANFISSNPGMNIPVVVANLGLTGTDVNNYVLTQPTYVTGNIFALPEPTPSPTNFESPSPTLTSNFESILAETHFPTAVFGAFVGSTSSSSYNGFNLQDGNQAPKTILEINNLSEDNNLAVTSLDGGLVLKYGPENNLTVNKRDERHQENSEPKIDMHRILSGVGIDTGLGVDTFSKDNLAINTPLKLNTGRPITIHSTIGHTPLGISTLNLGSGSTPLSIGAEKNLKSSPISIHPFNDSNFQFSLSQLAF